MSTRFRRLVAASLSTFVPTVVLLVGAWAQDPKPAPNKPDDEIDKLLESVGGGSVTKDAPAPKAKADDAKSKPKTDAPKGDKSKAVVDSKDKDLDDLLGSLGETKDTPKSEDRPKGAPMPPDGPMPPKQGADKDKLPDAQDKPLDERLEELTGRVKKKKQDEGDGEGKGQMGELVKQMREVEKRLKETDTGEQTQERQKQIIKNVDQMIEQARKTQMQAKSKKGKPSEKQGQPKDGDQQGEQQGALANGPPPSKPQKPTTKTIMNQSKDIWGHLDDKLREDMANIFKEEPLPAKDELIKRYYLAVSKKSLSRED